MGAAGGTVAKSVAVAVAVAVTAPWPKLTHNDNELMSFYLRFARRKGKKICQGYLRHGGHVGGAGVWQRQGGGGGRRETAPSQRCFFALHATATSKDDAAKKTAAGEVAR